MTFQVHLKTDRKPNQPRLRFDLEKLKDTNVAYTFQATIGGKIIDLRDDDMDINTTIIYTTDNTAIELPGEERRGSLGSRPL